MQLILELAMWTTFSQMQWTTWRRYTKTGCLSDLHVAVQSEVKDLKIKLQN